MPLVTRTSSQSTVYAQATAPTIVQDGETWVDTDTGASYTSENGSWVAQSVGAIGTARQNLAVNSAATELEYVSSLQSLMTTQADLVYASAANVPARLAKGTALHHLRMNSGATAPEWAAEAGTFTFLDDSGILTTSSGYTYTPSIALPFTTYSKIIVVIQLFSGVSTAQKLLAVINGLAGTANNSRGFRTEGSALTHISVGTAANLQLASTTLLPSDATGYSLVGTYEIFSHPTAIGRLYGFSDFMSTDLNNEKMFHRSNPAENTIISINIAPDTGSFQNLRVTTYGVKRV